MKIIYFLIFCILIGAGCSKSHKPIITLKVAFWGDFNEVNAIKDIAKKIEGEMPGVKLNLEHIAVGSDASRYSQKLLTEAASGTAPDIAFCDANLFVDFYFKDLFIDLTPYIKNDPGFSIDDYFSLIVRRFTVKERTYIIPRDVAPFAVVYYNKDLFDRSGLSYPDDDWTVYDLLHYAQKLTIRDTKGLPVQFGFYTWVWQNFIYCFGGRFVDDVEHPRKCYFDRPEFINGLQFYIDLMYKHKVMPTPSSLESGTQELFKTGRLAMYCSGIWETPALQQGSTFRWDIVMFPKGPGGRRGFATGGSGYGILKWSRHKDIAWKVLKYLTSADAQKHLARLNIAQPADKKLAGSEIWTSPGSVPSNKKMLNKAVEYIIFEPFSVKWNYVNKNILGQYFDPIFLHNAEIKPRMIKAAKEVDTILKEAQ